MQIGTEGPQLSGTIATVEPGVISPEQARKQYALNGNLALVVTAPSITVKAKLGPDIPAQMYAGSMWVPRYRDTPRTLVTLLRRFADWRLEDG